MEEKDKNIPQPQQPGNEPAETPQPAQPTEPIPAPAEPAQPVQPAAAPADPMPAPPAGEPVQPAQPAAAPAEPVAPAPAPAEPVAPAPAPAEPVAPVTAPAEPAAPAQPAAAPAEPAAPAQPAEQPAQPAQPTAAPAQPAQPQPQPAAAPAQPTQPMQPGQQPAPQPQQPGVGNGTVPPLQPPYTPGAGAGVKPKGTAALVCGILAIPVAWLSPLVAIVLAIVAIVLSRKAVKSTGKNGKTTGGLICGIIGIVCAIISFIIGIVFSVAIIGQTIDDASSTSYSTSDSITAEAPEDLTVDEQACYDLGIAKLDQLKNQDPALVDYIATNLDQGFADSMGISHEEMGSSAEAVATWMLTDFNYEFDGVYVDEESGTATMYADLEMRDSFAFMNNFYELADDFVSSGEAESMTAEEAAARLGELYNQAMDETSDMTSYYTAIDFVKQSDGTWAVDEGAWEDELGFMFGIY